VIASAPADARQGGCSARFDVAGFAESANAAAGRRFLLVPSGHMQRRLRRQLAGYHPLVAGACGLQFGGFAGACLRDPLAPCSDAFCGNSDQPQPPAPIYSRLTGHDDFSKLRRHAFTLERVKKCAAHALRFTKGRDGHGRLGRGHIGSAQILCENFRHQVRYGILVNRLPHGNFCSWSRARDGKRKRLHWTWLASALKKRAADWLEMV
jgi:hypothetical protein